MNPKLQKLILKGAVGFAISAVIGYTIKMEKHIEQRIDDHFVAEDDSQPTISA
jgi:hypothetical protein